MFTRVPRFWPMPIAGKRSLQVSRLMTYQKILPLLAGKYGKIHPKNVPSYLLTFKDKKSSSSKTRRPVRVRQLLQRVPKKPSCQARAKNSVCSKSPLHCVISKRTFFDISITFNNKGERGSVDLPWKLHQFVALHFDTFHPQMPNQWRFEKEHAQNLPMSHLLSKQKNIVKQIEEETTIRIYMMYNNSSPPQTFSKKPPLPPKNHLPPQPLFSKPPRTGLLLLGPRTQPRFRKTSNGSSQRCELWSPAMPLSPKWVPQWMQPHWP